MPRRHKPRILAIDPGTKHIGIAVLDSENLIHHAVETIKHRESPHVILKEGRRIVLRMIKGFRPDIIALEGAYCAGNSHNLALLRVLVEEIRALARWRWISFVSFAPSTVKKAMTGNGRATKADVARIVARQFSVMRVYIPQQRKWKARYHSHAFDAVAVALTALDRHVSVSDED